MASSRNSSCDRVRGPVADALRQTVHPGAELVLGLSGGVDSVTLLALLAQLAAPLRFSLRALHVDHGISPNAADWAQFCLRMCRRMGVPLRIERARIEPHRMHGHEGAARRARYEIFAQEDSDFLVLAHHRDDQAETLLLQLLRGAGPAGMAAMPLLRALPGSRARILRPLLPVARADIEACAREQGLEWIQDESNEDVARQRNFLRHRVVPLLEAQFPAARAAVSRAASHLAEAQQLLSALARVDLQTLEGADGLEVEALRRLGAVRAKNLLREVCRERGIPAPGAAQLEELLRQLFEARDDRTVRVEIPGWKFHRFRGRLWVDRARPRASPGFREVWEGQNALPLLELGGVLRFKAEEGRGLSVRRLKQAEVTVRLRRGGERLRPDDRRPTRTLKNLMQESSIPPWRRQQWPLLWCGDALVSVPGIGDDCAWRAKPGEAGVIVSWEPLGGPGGDHGC